MLAGDEVLDRPEQVGSQAAFLAVDPVEQAIEENLAEKALGKILGIGG